MASTRRALLGAATLMSTMAVLGDARSFPVHGGDAAEEPCECPADAEAALACLMAGNGRYAANLERHPHLGAERRRALASEQHPFALVLGCVDSRVPPEIIFDQGVGDLLTVRTAGEVVDEAVLGSVQYGVEELRIPLLVVLGHQRCGAVAATVEHLRSGKPLPGHLARLAEAIAPAALETRDGPGDWTEAAVTANVAHVRSRLCRDTALAPAVADNSLTIVGARFDLESGRVELVA